MAELKDGLWLGDNAVDWVAACGIDLLPWQQVVLRNALASSLSCGNVENNDVDNRG